MIDDNLSFRDYEKSKRRRYSNQEGYKDEPKEPKQEQGTKDFGLKALQEASRERSKLAETEAKNLKMENKELQKNSEIQMKKMEEIRRKNEELEKACSMLANSTKEQNERITKLEKEKNTLEEEKRNDLAEYKTEIDKERNELDDRFTELQMKYNEVQEHLKKGKLKENTAISGDDEELNMLRSKCSELELELKSKNTQLDAQEIDLNSKEEKIVMYEEKIVKLEEIKLKRTKEAIATGGMSRRCKELQAAKDELVKVLEEKKNYCAEILKASEGMDNERLELQKAFDEKDKDFVRLQNLLNEKQKLLDEKQNDNVQLSGERDVLEKNIKQSVLTQLDTLESVKVQCSREKEEKERISAKANLLEKKLSAKETEITTMLRQKVSFVAEADQLKKRVKEKETECASLASEKKKALAEAEMLKRRLKEKDDMEAARMDGAEADVLKRKLEATETELANVKQSTQMNNHTMESSRKNEDKAATDIKIEELQTALAEQEEFKKALQKELAANQDHLRKVC